MSKLGEIRAGVRRDPLRDLCAVLRSVGATLALYGKPTTEAEIRAYATGRVDERWKR